MQGYIAPMETQNRRWYSDLSYNKWVPLSTSGQLPIERFKHAATIADDKLYIVAGSLSDLYLSDFKVLDLKTLRWSAIRLKATKKDGSLLEVFLGTSGPSMIKWNNRLLLLGGFTRYTTHKLTVRYIDLESYNYGVVETFGDIPASRKGQSISRYGSKLIMFGGKDREGQIHNDAHVLDLSTMTWSAIETTQERPTPRFDHVAVVHAERYLYIVGGCSDSVIFTDLHVLDLERMEWSRPPLSSDLRNARAGHAGVAVDGNWYIVGGKSGAKSTCETLEINMSTLVVSVLTTVEVKHPLASEGLSISSIMLGGENFLITFGGYNGTFFNEIFAMRLKPAAAASTSNTAITITEIDGSDYLQITRELLRAQEQVVRNFQVGDFADYLDEELTLVPETELPLLPPPTGQELVETVGTSAEGGRKWMHWLKVEDEVLAHSFMAVSAVSYHNKVPSFWPRTTQLYNETKPPQVSTRTTDLMRAHWHSMKKKIYNFNELHRDLCSEYDSSHNAREILMLAHVKHKDVYNCVFKLEHVWQIVKDHPMFNPQAIDVPVCSRRASTSESGGCTSASNEEANAARISGQKRNKGRMTNFNTEQLNVQKKTRASNSLANQETHAGGVRITNETELSTKQLLIQTSVRAGNALSNQDANVDTPFSPNQDANVGTPPSPDQDANVGSLPSPNQDATVGTPPSTNQDANVGMPHSPNQDANVGTPPLPNQNSNGGTHPIKGDCQIIEIERNETGEDAEQMIDDLSDKKLKLELKKAKVEAMKKTADAKNREVWLKEYEILYKDTSEMTEQQLVVHAKACEIITRRWNAENV